jgi:Cof subfamily protein (haloacid dehalogenase superfamily)
MIELICIDVDGTLVGAAGTVPPEVWPAAALARSGGARIAVCSGRPGFGHARGYAERLDAGGWHVFQNGASVVQLATGESVSERLPSEAVALLVERARSTGRLLELYTDGGYAVESGGEWARAHAGLLGVPFARRAFESLGGGVVRAQWLVAREALDGVLAESYPGLEMAASTSPVMPDTVFVNMTAAGVNKGSAVRAVAAAYGVPLARVMFVGDGENDLSAMGAVGYPVAMANAEPAVRAAAARTVGHVDRGGLAEALALALAPAERLTGPQRAGRGA